VSYYPGPLVYAAAPELVEALKGIEAFFARPGESSTEAYERIAEEFYQETLYVAPGKDCRKYDRAVRQPIYDAWVQDRLAKARAALGKAGVEL